MGLGQALGWSRQTVYTVAFFAFWLVAMGACALTTLLRIAPAEVNECPLDRDQRPAACPRESGFVSGPADPAAEAAAARARRLFVYRLGSAGRGGASGPLPTARPVHCWE